VTGAPPDPSCYSPITIDSLERWRSQASPPPSVRTVDAVCDEIEDLCLAASLGLLPCCGHQWVDGGDEPAWIDYRVVGPRVDVIHVTTSNF
jgi:hypothetical protein